MGMKTPLMNIRGNLTRFERVIIFAGLSVGGVEKSVPKTAKQMAERRIVMTSNMGLRSRASIAKRLIAKGTSDRNNPKRNAAITSPATIVERGIGAANRRSRVRVRVSNGSTAGVVADAVKKIAIPIRPGTKLSGGTFRPMANAMNKKVGNNTPNMITGPRR
jgi:predicted transcriptional regulator